MIYPEVARTVYWLILFQRRVVEAEVNPTGLGSRLGQEAVAAGVCPNLRRRVDLPEGSELQPDIVVGPLSGLHFLGMGLDLKKVLAERFGRATGYCKGKGGSVHLSAPYYGVWGRSASLGADLPLAAGAAWGAKVSGTGQIVVCGIGDGSVNEGRFHEAMNFAQLHHLPVFWVYENNGLAHALENDRVIAGESVAKRVEAYGTPALIVDGNDALAVYEAAREWVPKIRRGDGPFFLECQVTRIWPERAAEFTPEPHVTPQQREDAAGMCPLKRFTELVLREGLLSQGDLDDLEARAGDLIAEALEFVENSSRPDPSEALTGVFAARPAEGVAR